MKVNLVDGSTFDLEDVQYIERKDNEDEIRVGLIGGGLRAFHGEDLRRIMAVVGEFRVAPEDITPDDIAHIDHQGFGSFANFLKCFRNGLSMEGIRPDLE